MKRSLLSISLLATLLWPGVASAQPHSNTQNRIPGNLYLADMNGDKIQDWLVTSNRDVFIARTNFQAEGYTFRRLDSKIIRAFTGYFSSSTKETSCFILQSGKLQCFGLSPDTKSLWWAWTQNNFVAGNEHAIVGDFTGDNKDDVLVYKPSAGTFRLYTKGPQGWFIRLGADKFDIGNLSDSNKFKNKQIRVGNFGNFSGEGTRDDLLIYDPNSRQVMRYDARKNNQGKTTFWWAFTTGTNAYSRDEEVTVANVLGGNTEQVVLHNTKTGGYRFRKVEYNNGQLKPFSMTSGQMSSEPGTKLFWGDLKHRPNESGGSDKRDDAIVYIPSWKGINVASGRWDGSKKTYWWAYTQRVLRPGVDQDGDGILTRYELGGLDADGDGKSDEPLHEYGASPFVKDVFVEVDYMYRASPRRDLRMSLEAQNIAIAAMAQKGINLHIFQDDAIAYQDDFVTGSGDYEWSTHFDPIKDANFTRSRWGLFHYAVFGNGYNGGTSSGLSRGIGGSDFIVTLGRWGVVGGTDEQQAGTFLHELGHNLNLEHGSVDGHNNKPNHLSIMNYNYQTIGISKNGQAEFLFSELVCKDLNENSVNELKGVECTVPNGSYRTYVNSTGKWHDINKKVNFDNNTPTSYSSSVKVNLNGSKDKDNNPTYQTLKGSVDEYGPKMKFKVGLIGQNMPSGVSAAAGGKSASSRPSLLVKRLHKHKPSIPKKVHERELDLALENKLKLKRKSLPKLDRSKLRTPIKKFQVLSNAAVPTVGKIRLDVQRVVGPKFGNEVRTIDVPRVTTKKPIVKPTPGKKIPVLPKKRIPKLPGR